MRRLRLITTVLVALVTLSGTLVGSPVRPAVIARAATTPTAPDVSARPDVVSAVVTAKAEGHRVQITDFDDTSTTTYANPNGTFTTEISNVPIRTHGPDGLVPVDTHLVAAGNSWKAAAADGGVTVSGGGSGDIASVLLGTTQLGIGVGSALPKPTIAGDTATYSNVAPGVNAVVRSVEGGFDLELVLTTRPTGPLAFSLPLNLHGLSVTQDASGTLHFSNAAGEVFRTSAPIMYGAAIVPQANVPARSEPVATQLVTTSSGTTLQVTPDPAFLADPTVTYPVTIDPSTTINQSNYAYTDSGCGTCDYYNNSVVDSTWSGTYTGIVHVGTYNSGADTDRGYYGFSSASYAGKYVTSATLNLYEYWAWSCTAEEVDIWDLQNGYTSTLDWNNQPSIRQKWASAVVAKGYTSSCGPGTVSFGVTALAQQWSNNASGVYDLQVRSPQEANNLYWKSFKGQATLAVTYDSYPNTPTNPSTSPATPCVTGGGRPYMGTATPTLSVTVSDPDGGSVQGAFEIWNTGGTEIGGQNNSGSVASGGTASWTVPAGSFSNGGTYSWRARTWDGVVYSQSYSPWCEFTIDTTIVPAPTVSSTNCPQNAWTAASTACVFSWSAASSDESAYEYNEDNTSWSAPSSSTSLTWTPAVGHHTLQVETLNFAGVPGTAASYSFDIGATGSLSTPADQDRTQASVALSSSAPTTYRWGTYWYRRGSTSTFTQITGDVTIPGTTTSPTWPVQSDTNGNFAALNWNLANTVRSAGGTDGLVQVEACFYASSTEPLSSPDVCSVIHNVQLVSHAFGATYATRAAGPGTVSLLTGDYQLDVNDASVPSATGSLSVGRTLTTSDPTGELRNQLPLKQHNVETDLSGFTPGNATLGSATSPTALGQNSLQITPLGSGTSNDTYAAVGRDSANSLGLAQGHTYTFTAHEFVPAATGLTPDYSSRGERPVFFWTDATGLHEIDGSMPTATNSWQLVFVTFTVPDGSASSAFIRIYNGFLEGKNAPVYYDDLTLMQDGIHGVGWEDDLPAPPAGASDLAVHDFTTDGYVILAAPDGGEDVYTPTTSTASYPINYTGQSDANDGSTLAKTSATQFTLTERDGTVTTWNSQDGGSTWQVASVTEPGSSTTTSYSFDGDGQVIQVVGPAPLGVTCTGTGVNPLATVGCRTLTLTYASTTSAPPSAGNYGNYPGLLESISFTAADPLNANAMTTVGIASFNYDSNGFLHQYWDPRLPNLTTTYTYGGDLRIASLTPPGLNSWSFSYDSAGRLIQVSRPEPAAGGAGNDGLNDVTTVIYDVPFTGAGAPIEMGVAATSAWGETADVPAYAAAVFTPEHVPAGTNASSLTSSDWPYASIHYLDVNGREVNMARYGSGAWQIATTGYDKWGNTVSELTALARNEALTPTNYPDLDGYVATVGTPAGRASLLSTTNTYSTDGTEVVDTLGPMHPVMLSSGSSIDGRAHTHTTYDQGAPNNDVAPGGGPYRLPTTITTTVQDSTGTDQPSETRTEEKSYAAINTGDTTGWTLRKATKDITDLAGGAQLITTTRYDAQGQVVETRMPAGTGGGDAHSTLNSYYTATGSGPCVNAANAGLLCQTAPGSQPASGPHLLTSTTTYTMWGQTASVTETDPGCSTNCPSRTSNTIYDTAQRECIHSIVTANVGDAALPAVYTGYDSQTGLQNIVGYISGSAPTTCPANAPTLTSSVQNLYDLDGRVDWYQDANGNHMTNVAYTPDGLISSFTGGNGSSVNYNVSYSYDGGAATEHRRLVTGETDSQVGTFAAQYNADGSLSSETYPNGLIATYHFNDSGQTASLSYAMGSSTWLTFSANYNAHGQIVSQSSNGSSQTAVYDNAGRLTQINDTDQTLTQAACTIRTFAYDSDTNRLSLASYPAGKHGVCTTTTTPTVASHTYDEADRIAVSGGYVYDALGRTTTVPATDAGGTALNNGYFANDMVASQSQGSASKSYALDPIGRIASITTGASVQTDYYSGSGDSPAWIGLSDGSWTRNVQDVGGNLAAILSSTGSDELQLTNLHGDVVATAPNTPSARGTDAYFESTEFGQPRSSNTVTPRYAWLGGKRRDSGDALGGVVLMGDRLYDPTIGRFLQMDPVPGGSANAYDYVYQDPLDKTDLDGKCWGGCWFSAVANAYKAVRHVVRGWARKHPMLAFAASLALRIGARVVGGAIGTALCGPPCSIAGAALFAGAADALAYDMTTEHTTTAGYIRHFAFGALAGGLRQFTVVQYGWRLSRPAGWAVTHVVRHIYRFPRFFDD